MLAMKFKRDHVRLANSLFITMTGRLLPASVLARRAFEKLKPEPAVTH